MPFKRSYEREILDNENIPFADIQQNMKELDFINTWLGGHAISINAFKKLIGSKKNISICEIGCGGGDNLFAIQNWASKKGIQLSVTGIDIKPECIDFAKSRSTTYHSINWITNDYRLVKFTKKPDIIFSSLFCHHFLEDDLIFQFKWMEENSQIGFFVNDLQRNVFAFYLIKCLTRLFSKSYLVKNDAPLSVARGFKHIELRDICNKAMVQSAIIVWKWAFRYQVIYKHEQ